MVESVVTFSWTLPVNEGGDDDTGGMTREGLWRLLRQKARNPVGYVPAIAACEIIEERENGLVREILRNGRRIRQEISFVPGERIIFRHVDDPEVGSITNIIGADEQGRLTFTIQTELTERAAASVLADSALARETDDYFTGTIQAIVRVLRASTGSRP